MTHAYYMQIHAEVTANNDNKLYDRYQADFDYEGTTDADGDTADYYRPIYAVRVG